MTEQDFRDQIEALVREGEGEGLSREDMLTELDGIVEAMREEAAGE